MSLGIRHIIKRALFGAVATVLLLGGWFAYGIYANIAKATGNSNPLQLVSALTTTNLDTTNGRTNILLAGYSADDTGHSGAELTDSIMILSINKTTKSAVIISIPRDLYVNIPGHGYSKINAAYEYGEADNFSATDYASGGMGLLEETIDQTLGIHSNYEALINYTAFKDLVNAVGGVTVTINSANANGLYDPNTNLQLANGTVTLTGDEALNLARARGDGKGSYGFPNGDFDRTAHQQQILLALQAKASSNMSLATISKLASALGNNVKTDMSLGDLRALYTISKTIPSSSIQSVTLNNVNGTSLLSNYTTPNGQSALIPAAGINDYSIINSSIANLLATNTSK